MNDQASEQMSEQMSKDCVKVVEERMTKVSEGMMSKE